jgi:hypothetical protein
VVDFSDPLVISSTNSAHNQTSSSASGALPLWVNVAIVGLVISSEKHRGALAWKPLKEENVGNFFRETGAASGKCAAQCRP